MKEIGHTLSDAEWDDSDVSLAVNLVIRYWNANFAKIDDEETGDHACEVQR